MNKKTTMHDFSHEERLVMLQSMVSGAELTTLEERLRDANQLKGYINDTLSAAEDDFLKMIEIGDSICKEKVSGIESLRLWAKTSRREVNETVSSVKGLYELMDDKRLDRFKEFVELLERLNALDNNPIVLKMLDIKPSQ